MTPNKYIVRYGRWSAGPGSGWSKEERIVWAYSAVDAKAQVDLSNSQVSPPQTTPVNYVGPVNKDACKCSNECWCGIESAQER